MIYRARRVLLDAVRKHRDTGQLSFTGDDIDFASIRAVSFAYPDGANWRDWDYPAKAAE